MGRYNELIDLIQDIIASSSRINTDELKEMAYEYYCDSSITSSQYDHILGLVEELC